MKKHITYLVLIVVLTAFKSYGQDFIERKHSDQFIKNCIVEVFQGETEKLVFNSTSRRYSLMKKFIKDQVVVEYRPEYAGKDFVSTNELQLNNKYNSNLQKDESYNPNTFNPLKYGISMFPSKRNIYRIGESDYIMIVSQSN